MAGLSANMGWDINTLSRPLSHLFRGLDAASPSRLDVHAEVAMSQPQQSSSQQAYLESFEGEGGVTVNLLDSQWQFSSQPAVGTRLAEHVSPTLFDTTRAATMAMQNYGVDVDGKPVTYSIARIDPLTTLAGGSVASYEQILWLTLYPLSIGGLRDDASGTFRWHVGHAPSGRRWRSVRTALGAGGNGVDLTRAEHLEFWTQVDTSRARRSQNPLLLLDFGDVSENSVTFSPESLFVRGSDSVYTGKKLEGFDVLNSERDRFSRAFSADVNDVGLPGDVVDQLAVRTSFGIAFVAYGFPLCSLGVNRFLSLGDARINCTVRNSRLDEEDIDQDAVLNYTSAQREQEKVRRFIVDLSDPQTYNRVGTCDAAVEDVNHSHPAGSRLCWVQVRVPFNVPDDSIGGGPLLRRVRALRVTMLSGSGVPDDQFTQVPIARLKVVGAAWLKRAARPLTGVGGERTSLGGFVGASVIGTQDRDSTRGLVYDPPPGVSDAPELQGTAFGTSGIPINERSMRLLAVDLPRYARAEAYMRFPEGERNMMTYRELRVWARGRGRGWGAGGDLQFFIKLGRDADNFYMYRTAINAGPTRAAWDPEIHVEFERFFTLRARLRDAYLEGRFEALGCTGADSALIAASALPTTGPANRLAACDGGYIVYSVNPVVAPPNLAAVQELAAGIVRVDSLRRHRPAHGRRHARGVGRRHPPGQHPPRRRIRGRAERLVQRRRRRLGAGAGDTARPELQAARRVAVVPHQRRPAALDVVAARQAPPGKDRPCHPAHDHPHALGGPAGVPHQLRHQRRQHRRPAHARQRHHHRQPHLAPHRRHPLELVPTSCSTTSASTPSGTGPAPPASTRWARRGASPPASTTSRRSRRRRRCRHPPCA